VARPPLTPSSATAKSTASRSSPHTRHPATASPLLGEHTRQVLADVLGMSEEEIDEQEMAGVLM
jgi:crotonobetainyl-CoA:carnitine CoA-transferase CaiB-like acyl-CoA transferase